MVLPNELKGGLSVTVSANITVSDSTAERCLRLLEMWQEDNPDSRILCENREDGTIAMRIVKWGSDNGSETSS